MHVNQIYTLIDIKDNVYHTVFFQYTGECTNIEKGDRCFPARLCRQEPGRQEGIMGRENIETALTMEMRRGTIVLVCLCCLDEPVHGYGLVEQLAEKGIPVEANTLYPLLRRLSSQGLLEDRWDTSSAKPRKYYCITEEGKKVRSDLIEQWNRMSNAMASIMKAV